MDTRRRLARTLLLPLLLLVAGCAAPSAEPANQVAMDSAADARTSTTTSEPMLAGGTIYVARHAETEGDGDGRWLTEDGWERARALADALEGAGIQRVFASDYRRTRETAQPIAERFGLEVETYDPRALRAFAEELKSLGQVVLVVGHSNTNPPLVGHLGGAPGPPIDEATEHDRLYRVEVPSGETVVTRYGE